MLCEDKKQEETVNTRDVENVKGRENHFSIYEYGKTSVNQHTNERAQRRII